MFGVGKKNDKGPTSAHPLNKGEGLVRTDMNCTHCSRNFIAQLDFSVDGNHIVECPYCGHEHCRTIVKGSITEDRWGHRNNRVNVPKSRVWESAAVPMRTSTASAFIRDAWLNRDG